MAKNKESIAPTVGHTLLSDAISLIGHDFLLLSNKRRQGLRNYINDRYSKICATDVPFTNQLFGDNCLSKLKEMGDINKYPIGKSKFCPGQFNSGSNFNSGNSRFTGGSLNFKGPTLGGVGGGVGGEVRASEVSTPEEAVTKTRGDQDP